MPASRCSSRAVGRSRSRIRASRRRSTTSKRRLARLPVRRQGRVAAGARRQPRLARPPLGAGAVRHRSATRRSPRDRIEPVLAAVARAQAAHPEFRIEEFGDASAQPRDLAGVRGRRPPGRVPVAADHAAHPRGGVRGARRRRHAAAAGPDRGRRDRRAARSGQPRDPGRRRGHVGRPARRPCGRRGLLDVLHPARARRARGRAQQRRRAGGRGRDVRPRGADLRADGDGGDVGHVRRRPSRSSRRSRSGRSWSWPSPWWARSPSCPRRWPRSATGSTRAACRSRAVAAAPASRASGRRSSAACWAGRGSPRAPRRPCSSSLRCPRCAFTPPTPARRRCRATCRSCRRTTASSAPSRAVRCPRVVAVQIPRGRALSVTVALKELRERALATGLLQAPFGFSINDERTRRGHHDGGGRQGHRRDVRPRARGPARRGAARDAGAAARRAHVVSGTTAMSTTSTTS